MSFVLPMVLVDFFGTPNFFMLTSNLFDEMPLIIYFREMSTQTMIVEILVLIEVHTNPIL